MSLNVRAGDLVQVRLNAGASTFRDVRTVIDVLHNGDLLVMGSPGGRRVPKRDVLCLFPVDGVCETCQQRPCDCDVECDERVL